jgi:hypothetical protein
MRGQPVDEREWQRVLERLPHRGLNGSH